MGYVLSTDTVASDLRLKYWTYMICSTFVPLGCDPIEAGAFRGSIQAHSLPGLDMSLVRSTPQRVLRSSRHIAYSTGDYFIVSIQTRGHAVLSQDGRDAVLAPGDFGLCDSTRPYVLHFGDEFEQVALKLRRDQLTSLIRDTDKLTATTISGHTGAGHVLIDMVRSLWNDIGGIEPASTASIAQGILNMLAASLQTLPPQQRIGASSMSTYHLARIKRAIDTRLTDPALDVEMLSHSLGLSIGHMHRLFKSEPLPLAHYIRNRRLEAASRDLLDQRYAARSVGYIAYACGFSDAAHFSRAFKERFGCTPREWRHGRRAGKAG